MGLFREIFGESLDVWRSLSRRKRICMVYFWISLVLLSGIGDETPAWANFLLFVNFTCATWQMSVPEKGKKK